MKKNNVEEDIKLLDDYMHLNENLLKMSKYTTYHNSDYILLFTNELMSTYPVCDLANKKVLSVTSSGDHMLNAILNGTTDITCFDINHFCKYYAALKVAMIKYYKYYDFKSNIINLFPLTRATNRVENFKRIFDKVKKYLTEDEIKFFDALIRIHEKDELGRGILSDNYDDFTHNKYSNEEVYEKLRKRLFKCDIKYYDMDIADLQKSFGENQFDVMYLSNILTYVGWNETQLLSEILKNLSGVMKDDGIIYGYNFHDFIEIDDNEMDKINVNVGVEGDLITISKK